MKKDFTIGRVAKAANCKVQTIRYYEQIGLIPAPARTAGNQRVYDNSTIQRLKFIRHARELGFPLQAIRDLTSLSSHPEQSCEAADQIAKEQLADVDHRLQRLQALRDELARMVEQCKGGRIEDCRVIEVLSDHNLCQTDDHNAPDSHS
ncbi:MerR family transcriptional regulator [Aestuariispira ectoiniformans]|uniref:MerR family transcriptional regulator n=1 Tax=Aestuariispira ectoiniformans TaxID=2775080 RepID=UPI00223AC931|nr:helix-turn-helix domain-containing protein [Aestuariispira ectoiniformans]